jgi:hypothetical protein
MLYISISNGLIEEKCKYIYWKYDYQKIMIKHSVVIKAIIAIIVIVIN